MDCLYSYDWPGNVRELKNLIERVVVVTPGRKIARQSLPARLTQASSSIALPNYDHTSLKAAMALGVNQSTIVRKAGRYGIAITRPMPKSINA